MAIRTFIYGSCVSRDTFERLPASRFELIRYVARQSVISATSPSPQVPVPPFHTRSSFQERMLVGDWAGSLTHLLEEHASSIDLLLWDLCDERLGVRRLSPTKPDASFCTRSVDSIRAGLDAQIEDRPLITFGSSKHRLLFLHALRRFNQFLHESELAHKTVLLAPPWATHSVSGLRAPASFGLEPHRANRLFADYYKAVELSTSIPILGLPPSVVKADPSHQWGLAPFHYTDGTYRYLTSSLIHVLDRWKLSD